MVAVKVLLAFVGRPSHGSHLRRTWNVAHWWMGRLLLLLGIVLVYDGLLLYRNGRSKSWIAQCLRPQSSVSMHVAVHSLWEQRLRAVHNKEVQHGRCSRWQLSCKPCTLCRPSIISVC